MILTPAVEGSRGTGGMVGLFFDRNLINDRHDIRETPRGGLTEKWEQGDPNCCWRSRRPLGASAGERDWDHRSSILLAAPLAGGVLNYTRRTIEQCRRGPGLERLSIPCGTAVRRRWAAGPVRFGSQLANSTEAVAGALAQLVRTGWFKRAHHEAQDAPHRERGRSLGEAIRASGSAAALATRRLPRAGVPRS